MTKMIRCAIYTRKSSEEGLEQGFNSLHAQREACEAYVLSQAGEGWKALPVLYDDGGFSGGSMERPGLKKLLADIERGGVDVVVVYKVDRLTRSLNDFARIVEAFDGKGVSFVSVTQAFNTTSSMGRLTLNVLLSFAQFEREVTGERIRDKIAASKRKGMWMGGNLPLGYDAPTDPQVRALTVNADEAETVRAIFSRYLELKSVHALRDELERDGVVSKAQVSARGRRRGGVAFSRGALFYLLRNRTYLGEIAHRKVTAATGAHPPIVDPETFQAVQDLLDDRAAQRDDQNSGVATMALRGKIFDGAGQPMSPAFTRKGRTKVYRYYVSANLLQGFKRPEDAGGDRLPAGPVEELVGAALARLSKGRAGSIPSAGFRIDVLDGRLRLTIERVLLFDHPDEPGLDLERLVRRLGAGEQAMIGEGDTLQVTIPCQLMNRGGRVWITDDHGRAAQRVGSIDKTLIRGLRQAHRYLAELGDARIGRPEDVVLDQSPADPYQRKLVRLAYLAPDIQAMILEGRQPPSLTLQTLLHDELPPCWVAQRRALGFVA